MTTSVEDISISKVIVHILNNKEEIKELNDFEIDVTEKVKLLLKKHIYNSLKNDARKIAKFTQEVNIVRDNCNTILRDESKFVECSKIIAEYLYDSMSGRNVSPANFTVCTYTLEGKKFIALLKMDFNEIFQTRIENINGKKKILITENGTGIPNSNQKLHKCVFFHEYDSEKDYDIVLLDKQAIKSQKDNEVSDFFSKLFLHCELARNDRDNTKNFLRYSQKFIEKVFENDSEKLDAAKKLLLTSLKEVETFNVNNFSEQVFTDIAMREEFQEIIANKVGDFIFNVDKEWLNNRLKVRKLKTDSGFEIKGDNDIFDNEDKFKLEYLENGKVNIIIKNVIVKEKRM